LRRRSWRRRKIWRRRRRASASRWLRRDDRDVVVLVGSFKPVDGESVDFSTAVQFERFVPAFHNAERPGVRPRKRRLVSISSNEDVVGVDEIRRDEVRMTTVSRRRNGAQSLDVLAKTREGLSGVFSFRWRDEIAGYDERLAVDEFGRRRSKVFLHCRPQAQHDPRQLVCPRVLGSV